MKQGAKGEIKAGEKGGKTFRSLPRLTRSQVALGSDNDKWQAKLG